MEELPAIEKSGQVMEEITGFFMLCRRRDGFVFKL
jgi:hypothetical protein